jgi:hypothetical protein
MKDRRRAFAKTMVTGGTGGGRSSCTAPPIADPDPAPPAEPAAAAAAAAAEAPSRWPEPDAISAPAEDSDALPAPPRGDRSSQRASTPPRCEPPAPPPPAAAPPPPLAWQRGLIRGSPSAASNVAAGVCGGGSRRAVCGGLAGLVGRAPLGLSVGVAVASLLRF